MAVPAVVVVDRQDVGRLLDEDRRQAVGRPVDVGLPEAPRRIVGGLAHHSGIGVAQEFHPLDAEHLGRAVALGGSPQAELLSQDFERIDAGFLGAGDILSAALAALVATGSELTDATAEALHYLDQALDHGFRPGMGRAVADRLFWAETEPGADNHTPDDPSSSLSFPDPINETKH